MEILDLYDENRIKTGKTYIRGEAMPENTYRLIVHLCIFDERGRLLIQRRQDHKSMGGLWDITCGGAARAGESSKEAIERELGEELGLEIDFSEIRPIVTANFKNGFDDFYVIRKEVDLIDLTLQSEEVADVKWATYEEVLNLIHELKFVKYKKTL